MIYGRFNVGVPIREEQKLPNPHEKKNRPTQLCCRMSHKVDLMWGTYHSYRILQPLLFSTMRNILQHG